MAKRAPAWVAATVALLLTAALAGWQHARYHYVAPRHRGLYDAAVMLREYAARDFTLATTEAGLLPLYSTGNRWMPGASTTA